MATGSDPAAVACVVSDHYILLYIFLFVNSTVIDIIYCLVYSIYGESIFC